MGKELKIILVLALVLLCFGGWVLFFIEKSRPADIITKVETRWDTLKIEKPVPVYHTLKSYQFFDFPVESVVFVDSTSNVQVEIPIETKEYKDSTYRAVISGFQPSLDEIEIYTPTTIITQTERVQLKPKITLSVGTGVGWNPITKQVDWSVGVYVGIPVWTWYGK